MRASVWVRSRDGRQFRLWWDGEKLLDVTGAKGSAELCGMLRWRIKTYAMCVPHGSTLLWVLSSLVADGFAIESPRPDSRTEWLPCR